MTTSPVKPGWYPSPWPDEPSLLRWWDGYRWTDRPAVPAVTPERARAHRRRGLVTGLGVGLVVVVVVVVGAVTSGGKSSANRIADGLADMDGSATAADYQDYEHEFGLLAATCPLESPQSLGADVNRVARAERQAGASSSRLAAMLSLDELAGGATTCSDAAQVLVESSRVAG